MIFSQWFLMLVMAVYSRCVWSVDLHSLARQVLVEMLGMMFYTPEVCRKGPLCMWWIADLDSARHKQTSWENFLQSKTKWFHLIFFFIFKIKLQSIPLFMTSLCLGWCSLWKADIIIFLSSIMNCSIYNVCSHINLLWPLQQLWLKQNKSHVCLFDLD